MKRGSPSQVIGTMGSSGNLLRTSAPDEVHRITADRDDLLRRWHRACELGDALTRAAEDFLTEPFPTDLSGSNRSYYTARDKLAAAIREYEEG